MSELYFFIPSKISADSIVEFCCERLKVERSDFLLVDSINDYLVHHEIDDSTYFLQYTKRSGEFDVWVEIFTRNKLFFDIDFCVSFVKEMSLTMNETIVMGDEYSDPYSYILIEPTGTTSTFDVDFDSFVSKDEVNFGSFQNHFFGQFALIHSIDEQELRTELTELFKEEFTEFELQSVICGPDAREDFYQNKSRFNELKHFNFHYDILPMGKQKWFSVKDKTDIFIDKMRAFSTRKSIAICLFPADYSKVENIEGGSDSENYCIVCDLGETTKIVYKNRRTTWKKSWFQRMFGR